MAELHSPGNKLPAIMVGPSNTYGSEARKEDRSLHTVLIATRSFTTDVSGVKHYDNWPTVLMLADAIMLTDGIILIDGDQSNRWTRLHGMKIVAHEEYESGAA